MREPSQTRRDEVGSRAVPAGPDRLVSRRAPAATRRARSAALAALSFARSFARSLAARSFARSLAALVRSLARSLRSRSFARRHPLPWVVASLASLGVAPPPPRSRGSGLRDLRRALVVVVERLVEVREMMTRGAASGSLGSLISSWSPPRQTPESPPVARSLASLVELDRHDRRRHDVRAELLAELRAELCSELRAELFAELRSDVAPESSAELRAELRAVVRPDVAPERRAEVRRALYGAVWCAVRCAARCAACGAVRSPQCGVRCSTVRCRAARPSERGAAQSRCGRRWAPRTRRRVPESGRSALAGPLFANAAPSHPHPRVARPRRRQRQRRRRSRRRRRRWRR